MREWVGIYLRGFCMGAADAVPGVSGGSVALITGIYDRLMAAVTALDPRVVLRVLFGEEETVVARASATLRAMDVAFLLVLGAGILTALVTAANVVTYALVAYRAPTFAFFFGLIAASAVVLADEVELATARGGAAAAVGFTLAFLLTGLPPGSLPHTPLVVFLSGAVAVAAMVLPGVSGSLLLLVLGQYHFMLATLREFLDALAGLLAGGDVAAVLVPGVTVVAFCAGAAIGLVSFAHLVSRALARHRRATLTFLVSLMVGALRKPVEAVTGAVDAWTVSTAAVVLFALLVGAALVLVFDRVAGVDY